MQAPGSPQPDLWRADPVHLWARAAALLATLVVIIVSPAQLIRAGFLAPEDRRSLDALIAPIETLVRTLLMAEAIAWLVTTEEGVAMLARAQSAPAPRRATQSAAARTRASVEPVAQQSAGNLSDAEVARLLAPPRLRFRLYDTLRPTSYVMDQPEPRPVAPGYPPRRPSALAALRLARRAEALRLIIARPRSAMLALARDLARVPLLNLFVPGVRNWIDPRWPHGRIDIHAARLLASPRFRYLMEWRDRLEIIALPPPRPG